MRYIIVHRKDGSVRNVVIWFDRATGKYAFVNLTTEHICKCRFDSVKDALIDLFNNKEVVKFMFKDENGKCIENCGACTVENCSWHEELEWLRRQQAWEEAEQPQQEREE